GPEVVGGDVLGAGGEGGFAAGGGVGAGFAGVGVGAGADEEALFHQRLDFGLLLFGVVHGEVGGFGRIGERRHEGGAALQAGMTFGVGLVGFGGEVDGEDQLAAGCAELGPAAAGDRFAQRGVLAAHIIWRDELIVGEDGANFGVHAIEG